VSVNGWKLFGCLIVSCLLIQVFKAHSVSILLDQFRGKGSKFSSRCGAQMSIRSSFHGESEDGQTRNCPMRSSHSNRTSPCVHLLKQAKDNTNIYRFFSISRWTFLCLSLFHAECPEARPVFQPIKVPDWDLIATNLSRPGLHKASDAEHLPKAIRALRGTHRPKNSLPSTSLQTAFRRSKQPHLQTR
jgi:hypothetical protein